MDRLDLSYFACVIRHRRVPPEIQAGWDALTRDEKALLIYQHWLHKAINREMLALPGSSRLDTFCDVDARLGYGKGTAAEAIGEA